MEAASSDLLALRDKVETLLRRLEKRTADFRDTLRKFVR
jgi:hypothetical protein